MKRGDRGIFWIFKKGRRGIDKGEKWETKGRYVGRVEGPRAQRVVHMRKIRSEKFMSRLSS